MYNVCNIAELQTILRDKNTNRSDFKFYADRLIRLVIEESLNQLPYSDCSVVTPTGPNWNLRSQSTILTRFHFQVQYTMDSNTGQEIAVCQSSDLEKLWSKACATVADQSE